jgi:hypothetical protein
MVRVSQAQATIMATTSADVGRCVMLSFARQKVSTHTGYPIIFSTGLMFGLAY